MGIRLALPALMSWGLLPLVPRDWLGTDTCTGLGARSLIGSHRNHAVALCPAEAARPQLAFRTNPALAYSHEYSSYWAFVVADCEDLNLDEKWCTDFAAWV